MKFLLATCIICIVFCLPVTSQESNSLEHAIKLLQQEIEATKTEIRALRLEQEKRDQIRAARLQQQEARRAAEKSSALRTTQRMERMDRQQEQELKKKKQTESLIKDREQIITTNELAMNIVSPVIRPKLPLGLNEQKEVVASLVIERNMLRGKIKRANQRWHCRWFHIGCIGRK